MKGSCLCGAVAYEIDPPFKVFQYCNCSRCRKMTGSAFSPNIFVPPERFRWTQGADQVGTFLHPDAKYYATAFCRTCGATLPWTVQTGVNVVVPAGTLDEDPGIRPQQHIFWDAKAPWYDDSCQLKKFATFPGK